MINQFLVKAAIQLPKKDTTLPYGTHCINNGAEKLPICLVSYNNSDDKLAQFERYEYCDISFCACKEEEFQCENKKCIPKFLTCNGVNDCESGSDESNNCERLQNIECNFEKSYMCGYITLYALSATRIVLQSGGSPNSLNRIGPLADHTFKSDFGHYGLFDSTLLPKGSRLVIKSPKHFVHDRDNCLRIMVTLPYSEENIFSPYGIRVLLIDAKASDSFYYSQVGNFHNITYNKWTAIDIPITTIRKDIAFQIEFTSYRMNLSDIDKVFKCERPLKTCIDKKYMCDGIAHCIDESDEFNEICETQKNISCTFGDSSSYLCGYRQRSSYMGYRWEKSDEILKFNPFEITGNGKPKTVKAALISPRQNFSSGDYCVEFTYESNTLLSLYKETDLDTMLLFKLNQEYGFFKMDSVEFTVDHTLSLNLVFLIEADDIERKKPLSSFKSIDIFNTKCSIVFYRKFSNILLHNPLNCTFMNMSDCHFQDVSSGVNKWNHICNKICHLEGYLDHHRNSIKVAFILKKYDSSCIKIKLYSKILEKISFIKEPIGEFGLEINTLNLNTSSNKTKKFLVLRYSTSYTLFIPANNTQNGLTIEAFVNGSVGEVFIEHIEQIEGICEAENPPSVVFRAYPPPATSIALPYYLNKLKYNVNSTMSLKPSSKKEMREDFLQTITLETFSETFNHNRTSSLLHCSWKGKPCQENMIQTHFSNIGDCFTFNYQHNFMVYQAGTGHGLKLLVDIETYDFLPNIKTQMGIIVSAIPLDDIHLIQDKGYAILTGTNSLLKIKIDEIQSLSEPYGSCTDKHLQYYLNSTYTSNKCVTQCHTQMIEEACDCKPSYVSGSKRDCNLLEYLLCIYPLIAFIEQKYLNMIDKPIFLVIQSCSTTLESLLFIKRELLKNSYALTEDFNLNTQDIYNNLLRVIKVISGFSTDVNEEIVNATEFDFTLSYINDQRVKFFSIYYDVGFVLNRRCYDDLVHLSSNLTRFIRIIEQLDKQNSTENISLLENSIDLGVSNLYKFLTCLNGLKDAIGPFENGKRQYKTNLEQLENSLRSSLTINDELGKTIQNLRLESTKYNDMKEKFENNVITIAELANSLTSTDYKSIRKRLNEFENGVTKVLVEPFLTEVDRSIERAVVLYTFSMTAVNELLINLDINHTSSDAINVYKNIRSFNIWRNPKLDTKLSLEVQWQDPDPFISRIWPSSQSLDEFLSEKGSAIKEIKNLIQNFMKEALRKVVDIENVVVENTQKIRDVLDELDNILAAYTQASQIDDDFIRKNIVELEIYYPSLQLESISQRKAYEIEDYFGDVGSYMGLLLGASVITALEFVDFLLSALCRRSCKKIT
ncbi:DgyrCDS8565 [Dimorphilus gyrociliatus]|uniref:DgyrCDS8565 n=1 Tax=Dimorphilus gyrociliatus TaxID=2664684 RepID=A0A7I8VUG7_9ANNE|nr:DgyrCDS8565 [Dimorphilus gyrociliatus]